MGFKTDTSFLRFLTMGAKGVRQTVAQLESMGFKPIELERYCGSNKIWATKVKRLRLPDLLCVKTGLRIEVRAKSDLAIKMSDAPNNPDRVWDAGLQDDDLAAFIACFDDGNGPVTAYKATFVRIGDMRESVAMSKLGPPKSASEGAERDREWPTTVPKRAGEIIEITDTKIVARMFATGTQDERRQSYQLHGKTPYVSVGDKFEASTCFISGAPQCLADLTDYLRCSYDPFAALSSVHDVDRYSAVKAFPFREDDPAKVRTALETLIADEQEARVQLEASGSATYFGSQLGQDTIAGFIWNEDTAHELRMEAVLILIELVKGTFTRDLLCEIASHENFMGSELRQAAVWGLGKAGVQSYADILPFIADAEENVALHAIAAFDENTPDQVIDQLVTRLLSDDPKLAPAASEALRIIGSDKAIQSLARSYDKNPNARSWIIATLGRMLPEKVRTNLVGHEALQLLEPMFLCADGAHWLSSEQITTDISFLLKQNI